MAGFNALAHASVEAMSAANQALTPTGRDRARSVHFMELDSFRTIAASALALLHVLSFSDLVNPGFPARVIYYVGHLNGMLFFPLSGFLVFRPIVARLIDGEPMFDSRAFLQKRFWRIFPAYWLVLTLLLMFDPGTHRPEGVLQTFGVYTFLHLLFPSTHSLGLGQAWTVGVELMFYISVPFFVAALYRRLRNHPEVNVRLRTIYVWLFSFLVGCWLLKVAIAPYAGQFRDDGYIINKSFYNYMDAICLGMIVATMREAWVRGYRLPRWAESLIRSPFKAWAIALGLEWLLFQIHRPPVPTNDYMTSLQFVSHILLLEFACTLMIFPFCFLQQQLGRIAGVLGSPAMRRIAVFSYGFYLWHFGVIHFLNRNLFEPKGQAEIVGRWLIVCALSLALGAATYLLFERRVLQWVDTKNGQSSARSAEPPMTDVVPTRDGGQRSGAKYSGESTENP